ncbi:hypothetical protein [Arenivirga flava]|uniref:2'-5' RNA ligase family protein n=1 Tax=Arenivirga flava TaxID=1930060 RepID=A0AA37XC81_9MICO|nr:hypothetical protein [Arenivirga flava]GMA29656.1 hypothetical protein GCM10025874_29090 [Arenivirga flava]
MTGMGRIPAQSIELLLDADAEAGVREDWRRLQAAGLSSLGAHTAPSNAPHVTLAAGPRLEPPPTELWSPLPLPVRFGGLLLFGEGSGACSPARSFRAPSCWRCTRASTRGSARSIR